MERYIGIDEEGAIAFDGVRVEDEQVGATLLSHLEPVEKGRFVTKWENQEVLVEAFDEPLVARHVNREGSQFFIHTMYGLKYPLDLTHLCVDEWDRFHGVTENKVSFVFSRSAQMDFFDLVDEFDDESVSVSGVRYLIPPFYMTTEPVQKEAFWTNLYETETPGWELGAPANALVAVLPQLKLTKSRVLVLGCGSGEDAAYLAQQGHLVTAVDFSPQAIARAKQKYADVDNLEFFQQDIFSMNVKGSFDLIFEHACFAAIDPSKREELIRIWRNHLIPGGHLLGVFFIMSKRSGPPFGCSEWELRERLKKHFRFLYWTRWRHSIERRKGRELVIYAQKTS